MTEGRSGSRARHRWLGLGLVLYGALGIALALAGVNLVALSFRGVDRLAAAIEAQRNTLVFTLDTTASLLADAAGGTGSVDDVLDRAVAATRDAATMTRSLAGAADQVAETAQFQILGQRPFADVATSFAQVGTDARTLAADLDGAADSIAGGGGEVARLRGELQRAADQVRQFSRALSPAGAFDDLEHAFDAPRLVLFGLLGWLGAQAAAFAVAGLMLLLRRSRPPGAAIGEHPSQA